MVKFEKITSPLTNDFIEQSDTLHPLIDILGVEVCKVRDGSKKNSGIGTSLGVEVLGKKRPYFRDHL